MSKIHRKSETNEYNNNSKIGERERERERGDFFVFFQLIGGEDSGGRGLLGGGTWRGRGLRVGGRIGGVV